MVIENLEIKKQFYSSLNERQRRHYAAQLAIDLGHGGIKSVCGSFRIDPVTVRKGINELKTADTLPLGRVRKEGGGRKKKRQLIRL